MGQTSKKQVLSMNKQLSATELGLPSSVAPHVMTRREKLLRFAMIVRTSQRHFVVMFHHLEYMTEPQVRDAYHPESAFAAAADPILSDAGLASDIRRGTTILRTEQERPARILMRLRRRDQERYDGRSHRSRCRTCGSLKIALTQDQFALVDCAAEQASQQ
jgi:hypothetical protein